jgi:hypothetical protein
MKSKKIIFISVLLGVMAACGRPPKGPSIFFPRGASVLERFAASELRRYFYLRTGELSSIEEIGSFDEARSGGIMLGAKDRLALPESASEIKLDSLGPEDYRLLTIGRGSQRRLLIAGGSPVAALYGVYAFIEKLGVRFYLEGDVVPDERIEFAMPDLDETAHPLFVQRGIQPFHDFAEGPDWWTEETYKTILGQLPKLRMNFFGLHTYPEKNPNAEPAVWIGSPGEAGPDGRVKAGYPSSWQNTLRSNSWSHNWGYRPKPTSLFHFGAAGLFDRDDYGPEIMAGLMPEPRTPEDSAELFNRAGVFLRNVFSFARRFGVRTCVGTETPLTVPAAVRDRLKSAGKDFNDPKVVKEIYKGLFERIRAAYPIDYYWFWTSENWTWSDASEKEILAVTTDLAQAVEAAAEVQAPFGLATSGWVLGPPSRRTLFDEVLPKTMAVSAINREVGKAPVDPMFARISGRSKWAIPWMEDDPALTSPQLWAGRMRRDAADALRYGCDGLLGIHWRTRVLSPNIGALAHAAWDQSWNTVSTDTTGPVNGQYVAFADKMPPAAGGAAVYRDIRDRVFGYHLSVPDGTYRVTLKLIENEIDRKGGRVFDVLIRGKRVAEKVDIFAAVGRFKPYDLTLQAVEAVQGRLDIDFGDRVHYPSVAAIVVEGRTAKGEKFVKKINCGGPTVSDYEADWPETPRHLPVLDFYRDWATNQFGSAVAEDAARIFARLDGKLPVPVQWTDGPGGIVPDRKPWVDVAKDYGFVDELAALRGRVQGIGSAERLDYWVRTFEYQREIARYRCCWGEYDAALEAVKKLGTEDQKTKAAWETLLPARVKMIGSLQAIMGHLLATVSNTGELGTIANWEQHLMPPSVEQPGEELAKWLGGELPAEALVPTRSEGPARIIVPSVRASADEGEPLKMRVILLGPVDPAATTLHWRVLGKGRYQTIPLRPVARGVYEVELPRVKVDLEYFLEGRTGSGVVRFPATAPALNQTVVVIPK